MTKTIHICDRCKKEVDRIYKWPYFSIDGLVITISQMGFAEYCKDCSQILIAQTNGFKKEGEKNENDKG